MCLLHQRPDCDSNRRVNEKTKSKKEKNSFEKYEQKKINVKTRPSTGITTSPSLQH